MSTEHLGFKPNTKNIQILTPNGYEIFHGINKIRVSEHMRIKFDDHAELKCSLKHPFIKDDGSVIQAKHIKKTDNIKCLGGTTNLQYSHVVNKSIELYDVVNSGSDYIYFSNGILSHNCKFMGSAGTLINGRTLEKLTFTPPVRESDHKHKTIRVYAEPVDNRKYVTIVDTSEGVQLDFSVITVIDVSSMPYKQVFLYKDNTTPPLTFASIAAEVAEKYNHSVMLVENNNSSGGIVSNTLWNDIEYDNMLTTKIAINTRDTEIGFDSKSIPGVRTTKKTKAVGCTYLKNLIESDQLQITDYDTISELSTFVRVGSSYEAEKNKHDDIVMTLVMFAWFTSQDYFEDETGISSLSTMNETLMEDNDMDFVLGFISNGTEEVDEARALFDKGLFN